VSQTLCVGSQKVLFHQFENLKTTVVEGRMAG
jgi:hypothetical protein